MPCPAPSPMHPTPERRGAFQNVVAIARTHQDAQDLIKDLVSTGVDARTLQLVVPRPFLNAHFQQRRSYAKVAFTGASRGAWFGLLVGAVLSYLDRGPNAVTIIAAMIGLFAGVSMALGVIIAALAERFNSLPACYHLEGDQYLITCTDKSTLGHIHRVISLVVNHDVITVVDGTRGPTELEYWLPVPALMPGARSHGGDQPALAPTDTADLSVYPSATGMTYSEAMAAKARSDAAKVPTQRGTARAKNPTARAHGASTQDGRSHSAQSQSARSHSAQSPAGKTPSGKTPHGKTPSGKTPSGKTRSGKTQGGKSQGAKARTRAAKTAKARSAQKKSASPSSKTRPTDTP